MAASIADLEAALERAREQEAKRLAVWRIHPLGWLTKRLAARVRRTLMVNPLGWLTLRLAKTIARRSRPPVRRKRFEPAYRAHLRELVEARRLKRLSRRGGSTNLVT
jgi:hypothetical protein